MDILTDHDEFNMSGDCCHAWDVGAEGQSLLTAAGLIAVADHSPPDTELLLPNPVSTFIQFF
jgi:hypothetical protein